VDLAAEEDVDVELVLVALEGGAVELGDAADVLADDAGGVVHGRGGGQATAGVEFGFDQRDHGLGEGEAAAGKETEDALARLLEEVHLSAGVDLVHAGVGAGVGGHDQAVAGDDAQTVSHPCPLETVVARASSPVVSAEETGEDARATMYFLLERADRCYCCCCCCCWW
jgi:hypothetical protein